VPATFEVANQRVTVTFPAGGQVSQSFELGFSTRTNPRSKSTKLKFESVGVYLNKGVEHTSKAKHKGRTVTSIVYGPNASMKSASGTLTVGLGHVAPGSYTCKVEINYEKSLSYHGLRVTLPYTSTIAETITVTG